MQAFLISKDEVYSGRLILLLNKASLLPFKFQYINLNIDKKQEFDSKTFLLFDIDSIDFYEENIDKFINTNILYLYSDIYLSSPKEFLNQDNLIYKFQNYKNIQKAILGKLSDLEHLDLVKSKEGSRIISIYSPVNRCGKSLLALNLSKMLSKDKKVLFISFDNYCYFENNSNIEKLSLSDFIYNYFKFDFDISRIKKYINISGNLHFINGVEHPNDIYSLNEEEYYNLFKQISKKLDYDYFIVDLSFLAINLMRIIELSFKFVVPFIDDSISLYKLNKFKDELKNEKVCKEIDDKIIYLEMNNEKDIFEKAKIIKADLGEQL